MLVKEMGLYTGGSAVNAATALAELGLPVEVIGKVGRDPFGDFIVNAMQERGNRYPWSEAWCGGRFIGDDGDGRSGW